MGGGATGGSSDGKLHWIKILKNGANLCKWWGSREHAWLGHGICKTTEAK